ncbi:hypothetical protein [Bacillus sp. RS11]|uniref:hypothetical protein n=1 Tax=Lysinibacillus sp. RS11 TaxID=3242682 RepID=UPI0035C673C8
MKENTWKFQKMDVKKSSVSDFNWLSKEQLKQIKHLLNHLNLEINLDKKIIEQNAVELTIGFDSKEVKAIMQEAQLDEKTKIEIQTGKGLPFFARITHIEGESNEDGSYIQHLVTIEDNVIIIDQTDKTTSKTVEVADLMKALNTTVPNTNDISPQGVPCIQDGCCVFNEPAWVGGPMIPVMYNWCGANCGSGTPVNSTDTCCRTHDNCYTSFTSYPDRCSCDKNLINCIKGQTNPGANQVRIAFQAKLAAYC